MSNATVLKVSTSGKSIFVRATNPLNPFDSQGIVGYCTNPDGKYAKGDVIPNFPQPTGIEHRKNEDGAIMVTASGEPLSFLKW